MLKTGKARALAVAIVVAVWWIAWDYPQWLDSVVDMAARPDAPGYIKTEAAWGMFAASLVGRVGVAAIPWLVTGLAVIVLVFIGYQAWNDQAKPAGASKELPPNRPKVGLVRYGKDESRRRFDGLIFLNEGESAYDLSVPNLLIDGADIHAAGQSNILKQGDELFCELSIQEGNSGTVNGLAQFMRDRKLNQLSVSIYYRDFDGRWYATDCSVERNFFGHAGISIGPFTQRAVAGPPVPSPTQDTMGTGRVQARRA